MPAAKRIFISYRHTQADWVRQTLYPVLAAGGATITVDYEQFRLAKPVRQEMERAQQSADIHLLVMSRDYLASDYCREEMQRAIKSDPGFREGKVVVLLRESCEIPQELKDADLLYADLSGVHEREAEPWGKLMQACGANLGTAVPHWLEAFRRTVRALEDRKSVALRVVGLPRWRELMEQVRLAFPKLGVVDLDSGRTAKLEGVATEILRCATGFTGKLDKEDLLGHFERVLETCDHAWVALTHFDMATERNYGKDFYSSLRYMIEKPKKLTLLVQSRATFASCLAPNHALSYLEMENIELRAN